jgi:recombination associated protein RdgC
MWFKNLLIYRLSRFDLTPVAFAERLAEHALQEAGGSMDRLRLGFVPPKGDGEPFVHQYGQQMLIALGVEKKLLPSSVINQFAKARAQEIEEQQGYKPGRKQMKQIKEAMADELLPRAFALRRSTRAWIDPVGQWLVVDAASLAKADEVVEMLLKHVEGIAFAPLKTQLSPMTSMTGWLLGGEAPAGFSLDDDYELRGVGEGKSSVRYTRHSPDADEIRKHVESGKSVTRLAMSWNDRVSFVLDENLQVKRVAPLDVLTEQADADDDAFDSDFALMTGEVAKMLLDLVAALGGEVTAS